MKIDGKKVTRGNEVEVRGLPEGAVFSADGRYLYVGNFIDQDIIDPAGRRRHAWSTPAARWSCQATRRRCAAPRAEPRGRRPQRAACAGGSPDRRSPGHSSAQTRAMRPR